MQTVMVTKDSFLDALKKGFEGMEMLQHNFTDTSDRLGKHTKRVCSWSALTRGLGGMNPIYTEATGLPFTKGHICSINNDAHSKEEAIQRITSMVNLNWPEGFIMPMSVH